MYTVDQGYPTAGHYNAIRWLLIFVVPQYETSIMSTFRRLECLGGSYILRKFVHPVSMGNVHHKVV